MLTVIYAILGFVILVFFHELGHFFFAKMGGIAVEEFAIGMGKTVWGKKYRGTFYKIGLIPFGGYCKLKGQDDFGPVLVKEDEKDNFFSKPPYIRFLVSFGGPFFSYLLGFVFLSLALFSQGEQRIEATKISVASNHSVLKDGDEILSINGEKIQDWEKLQKMLLIDHNKQSVSVVLKRENKEITISYVPDIENRDIILYGKNSPVILDVKNDSAAMKDGVERGDQILSINSSPVTNEQELKYLIQTSPHPLKIVFKRVNTLYSLFIESLFYQNSQSLKRNPEIDKILGIMILEKFITPELSDGKKLLGISFYVPRSLEKSIVHYDYSIPGAFAQGFKDSFNVISASYKGIVYLIRGDINVKENLSGPIQIFSMLGKSGSEGGIFAFIKFAAFISLALAFFNFLPFPALDGGHMVLSIIEMITRKRVNPKVMSYLQVVGISILLLLLVFVSVNDLVKMAK
ncbi:MAG TPA: RIP metalloprotease RseP [Spirochaetia bacterium]|nr:MAG: RIP metalloprotease RseP [Spirochaetes bacterium GWB1_36_13]HCL56707.1 RIP metalloprotease RseP [Spirochaetia bacterium]